jgi:hypothetical protein
MTAFNLAFVFQLSFACLLCPAFLPAWLDAKGDKQLTTNDERHFCIGYNLSHNNTTNTPDVESAN